MKYTTTLFVLPMLREVSIFYDKTSSNRYTLIGFGSNLKNMKQQYAMSTFVIVKHCIAIKDPLGLL